MDQKRPELPETAQWYYLRGGDSCGPVSASELRQLVVSGEIPAESLVWRDGMGDWLPACDLGLASRPTQPLPPPVVSPAPGAEVPPQATEPFGTHRQGTLADHDRPRRRRTHSQIWAWGITAAVTLAIAGIVIGHSLLGGGAERSVTDSRRPPQRVSPVPGDRGTVVGDARAPNAADQGSQRASSHDSAAFTTDTSTGLPSRIDGATRRTADEAGRKLLPGEAVSSSGATGPLDTHPPVALPRIERPRVLYQEIVIHRRPSFGVMGTSMDQDIQYAILTRLERQPPLDDGTFRVLQEVVDTRLDRSDPMSRAAYEAQLKKLIGDKHVFTLNSDCEVTRFDGYEAGLSSLPVDMAGGSGFQMTQILDKDGWKEVVERSLLEPARHIAPGQSWTRQMAHDFSPLGQWAGKTTFTQDTTKEPPLLHFKYRHEMTFTPAEGAEAGLPLRISDAKFTLINATGTFTYDPAAQHVTQVDESFHVRGSITTELLGSAGSLEFEERQEWSIRLSTQNPWLAGPR